MKNSVYFLLISMVVIVWSSCKDDVEDAIDCTVETAFLSLDHQVDENNPLLVHFTFVNGDTLNNRFTLDQEIRWEFGDGNEETTQGLQVSHTYPDVASYEVKAFYTLRKGDASCSSSKNKTINLQ